MAKSPYILKTKRELASAFQILAKSTYFLKIKETWPGKYSILVWNNLIKWLKTMPKHVAKSPYFFKIYKNQIDSP